ncbi:immunoglobulin-like and fibronectin type III domain-containing protein 1 isoform X19 [Thunnus albacares]|uniref:immunoglobulin-like and fibronectin type III domain-containing protein 1 isoform X19 n=1 Tax=Thunnus albacares TaxID=8236 RepID=UPI001CF68DFF|nr:immunoglobulin-like and fibronectin type III domain-containing protein 1 isoform X19 [Thunnus albacares]
MFKRTKVTDGTATGQGPDAENWDGKEVGFRKKSKVPGVMITQYIEKLPEGKSHPDFTRKPIALTIQEGKFAFFKAIVTGDPKPTVVWSRNNGDVSDPARYQSKYDPNSNEHTFEMPHVKPDQADTYKCFAKNEYGQAMVTVVLNVIEVGFKMTKAPQQQAEVANCNFKKVLKRRSKVVPKAEEPEKKEGEIDPKFWELLMSADKKDYERICAEFGVTDFRWMLKKLNEMKREREEEQAEFVKNLSDLKPIHINADGTASFELEFDLLDPSSSIYLYKDGEMIPYTKELGDKMKHCLRKVGRKYIFSMRDLMPEDAGFYQLDVEDVNMFSTDFKMVDFLVKIQEVKAMEREDAVFECVISAPLSKLMWFGKNMPLEQGDKYDIEVSEDKLIHRLVVKDCMVVDKGIYAACAGIKSCNAWLVVEADKGAPKGKKTARKTTRAGGSGTDLQKVAQEQQQILDKEREERKEKIKAAREAAAEAAAAEEPEKTADSGAGKDKGAAVKVERIDKTSVAATTTVAGDSGSGHSAGKASGGAKQDGSHADAGGGHSAGKASGGARKDGSIADAGGGHSAGKASGGAKQDGSHADAGGGHSAGKASGGAKQDGSPADAGGGHSAGKASGGAKQDGSHADAGGGHSAGKASGGAKQDGSHADAGGGHSAGKASGGAKQDGSHADAGGGHSAGKASGGAKQDGSHADAGGGHSAGKASGGAKQDGSHADAGGGHSAGKASGGAKQDGSHADAGGHSAGKASGGAKQDGSHADAGGHSAEEASGGSRQDGSLADAGGGHSAGKASGGAKQDGSLADAGGGHSAEEASGGARQDEPLADAGGEPGITSGLSDIHAIRGQPAELTVKMNTDCDGAWFKDGEPLKSGGGISITKDANIHKLTIHSCRDTDSGLLRFVSGDLSTEGRITVGDVPEFDEDDLHKFSKPVIVRVGQNAAFKMPFQPQESLTVSWFKDGTELKDGGGVKIVREPNHSRLLLRDCLRSDSGEIKIQLKNPFGAVEATSQLIVLDRPGPPEGPVETVETTSSVIEIKWNPPKDDGGSAVTNYIIERQERGHSLWTKLGDVSAEKTSFRDRNVTHGKKYSYRIYAENPQGLSDSLETADSIMAGIMILSGPPGKPKVVSTSKTCINLTWTPPEDDKGVPIIGYQVEKRKKDTNQWLALNAINEPIEDVNYAVKDVTEGAEYEFRVSAINESGAGDASPPSAMACAKNPNMRPCFKDPEDFLVVRAGNSVRVKISYEAEPPPHITWLKDDEPIAPWINVINTEGMSQLVIPSSKRSDSAIYTIKAKNSVGEAFFDVEVRVTDEPKCPGPVELEQTVYGKVAVSWVPSPDQELDDRLYYVVSQHDSNTRMWKTVADRLFANTYTAHNILPGIEYHFRVYAKNDMGLSDPSQSPTWGANSNRVPISSNGVSSMEISFERPPSILVPLKVHTPPKGYQLYMTCAVRGCPTPNVSWYLNNTCINSDKNYYITNSCGVCSMYILRVRENDGGEYRVVAVNSLGKAECSTKLTVRD